MVYYSDLTTSPEDIFPFSSVSRTKGMALRAIPAVGKVSPSPFGVLLPKR
jgi:hypothetical protein